MSNILLALLFALLCFTQWQLSRQGTSLLCYLPTGLYLLIVGIASVRTILDDTFSLPGCGAAVDRTADPAGGRTDSPPARPQTAAL